MTNPALAIPISLLVSLLFAGQAYAQVSVDVPGVSVRTGKSDGNVAVSVGQGATAVNTSGVIGAGVEMEGVAVVNGDVFIDGEKIQRGKTRHTAKKTGITYRIQWGKDGNVNVQQN
ncbi:MAG: hypothetical protein Q8L93_04320 [Rhodocyclaceae bacterium]|nr:hypothetical protein [Rhodocyclaceae bacterium]